MWLNHSRRRTKQFVGGKNLPECSKQNISKCIVHVLQKKVFTKILLKTFITVPSLKKATNLKRFVAVQ